MGAPFSWRVDEPVVFAYVDLPLSLRPSYVAGIAGRISESITFGGAGRAK